MKRVSAKDFFTEAEKERIKGAVSAAERTTSGEIAIMIVDRSDNYRDIILVSALLGASLTAFVIAVALHHVTIWSYIPLVLLLMMPFHWIVVRVGQFQRPFLTSRRREEAVRERAVRAFYEKNLHRTRHETGILLFISLFERKVWILGDRGINRHIPPDAWQKFALEIASGLREDNACSSLCSVIDQCGQLLSRHFPIRTDDQNELPDDLIV